MKDNKNQENLMDKAGKPLTEKPLKKGEKRELNPNNQNEKKGNTGVDVEDNDGLEEDTDKHESVDKHTTSKQKDKTEKQTAKRGNL